MSLSCDIKDIKELLEGLDTEVIATLCDKIEVLESKIDFLEEKLCGPCPKELAEEMTSLDSIVLEGDVTDEFVAGENIDLLNDAGEVVGTATVAAAEFNEATQTTTVKLEGAEVTGELSAVTSAKLQFVSKAPLPTKEETVKEPLER